MTKENKLIELYCTVCHYYGTVLAAKAQRMSNNDPPLFTDSECVTVYLFGIAEGRFTVKSSYNFVRDFFPGWFPHLPTKELFNNNMNKLL
jgi:hypothetical protein